ncbi:YceI family protein [Amycolatopsis sp. NPDC098790]|uniref:YceI family protein n=1 Tax=Amycolatopsis sp. NPDC098790 TaxID=3363939 RepID=UPI00382CA462
MPEQLITRPLAARTATPDTGTWTVQPGRTRAAFAVRTCGLKVVRGAIPVCGGLARVGPRGVVTLIRADLDLSALDTGNSRRDAELRKPHLLDSAAASSMTFVATAISRQATGWVAQGELRLGSMSCPLDLLTGPIPAAYGTTVRVRATGVLDRTPLGIRASRFVIGRLVAITIDAWLEPPGRRP